MKIRVKVGPYDPDRLIENHAGSIEPQGREIWCGGEDDLSGAVLNLLDAELRLGTWYPFADFKKRVNDFAAPNDHDVPSTLAIRQEGGGSGLVGRYPDQRGQSCDDGLFVDRQADQRNDAADRCLGLGRMNERITLDECGSRGHLRSLPATSYVLEYHDSTHLPGDTWIQLAEIQVQGFSLPGSGNAPTNLADEHAEQFFVLTQAIGDLPGDNGRAPAGGADNVRRQRVVADTLALALGRCGLLAPAVPEELLTDLISLNREGGVVLVPDTNALHNGAMHWLLRVLDKPAVWILPLVASITTVQTRDATVKGLVGKGKIANITQALRSRGLVNGALGLLERNKGRSQVVEIDASLLRYQRMSSQNGTDPDQGDVLEDRLIIEGVHNVLKSMRSRNRSKGGYVRCQHRSRSERRGH